jgi:hypothetical protein
MCYHVFVPYHMKMSNGKPIVYYCVDFNETTWQAGAGGNAGFGVGFQGMFRSRHIKRFRPFPGTNGNPSDLQRQVCIALFREWFQPLFRFEREQLTGHWQWGKAACPGDWIENAILEFRSGESLADTGEEDPGSEWFDTWAERQAALFDLGYNLGEYGPQKNGVDGYPGDMTRMAIELFQEDVGIEVTGLWDDVTEDAMMAAFKDNGLNYDNVAQHLPDDAKRSEAPAEKPAEKPKKASKKKLVAKRKPK